MSRCFPFPPPGYVLNGLRGDDEAMIESIKRVEEKCKKEQRRKERKRDKKDKKRERGEGESVKHSHKRRRHKEEVAKDVDNIQKVDVFRKLKESENNCLGLEKSSLTVERELVQSTSQTSCDSTLNSNEKKKTIDGRHNNKDSTLNSSNELPKEKQQLLDGRHNNNNNNNDSESIIRIRLPIRRPKDPEVMVMITNKDQPCPSRDIKLDTSQSITREQPQHHPCSTSAPEHASKTHEEKRKKNTSTRKHREKKPPSTTQETYQPSTLCRLCPPSMAEQFLNVVENWVPSKIESITNSGDDDDSWLLLMKKPSSNKTDTERRKQLNRNNEAKKVISSSIAWPRASLLPEADVYALPYTVPF